MATAGREPFDGLWFNVADACLAGADNGGGALKPVQDGDPKHIGPYQVIGLLGAGGMGRVYLGHRDDGVTAAVKVINEELAQDTAFRERFRREVVATKAVTGPYVAAVIDYDVESEQPWLATEYVPAPSMHTVITKRGPLDAASVRTAGARLAEALTAIHAAGLVHRDVKPGNILLSDVGPKLIDFGIARGAAVTTLTQTGAVLGTPQYMAPEQLRGRARVGPAADVFALGLVLAFAVTGEHPFGQDDSYGIGFRIVYEEPQLDLVQDELAAIIRRCLAKQPEDRPTPEELAAALRAEEPDQEPVPVPVPVPVPAARTLPEGGAAAEEAGEKEAADPGGRAAGAGAVAGAAAGAVVAVVTDPADEGDVPDTEGGAGGGTTTRTGPLPAGGGSGGEVERGPRRRMLAASAAAGAVALVVLLAVTLEDGGSHAAAQGPGGQGTPRSSASAGSTPSATGGTPGGGSGSPSPSRPSASGGAPGRSAGAKPPGSSAGATGGSNPGSNGGSTSGSNGGSSNGSSGGSSGGSNGGGSNGGGTSGSSAPTHGSTPTTPPPAAGRPPGNMAGFKALYNEYCFGACSMPLTVSWSAESGATSYDIHYTDSNGSVDTVYSTGGTSYTIDGPYSGDNICVSVRAANAYGASAWTPSYCGTTPY